jgi:3-methyladenine DNA glycosylase/8-oxoguanine DNA glycosylase
MWQLHMTNAAKKWVEAGSFDSVTAATRRIIEIEGYPITGIHLEMHVDTLHGTDEEAFAHLEHTGRRALYVVKRVVQ